MRGRLKVSLPWLDGHLRKVGSTGSVSARASKYRCAELKPPVTQAASKMPSNATVLRRSQFTSARAVARDLTEPDAPTVPLMPEEAGDAVAYLLSLRGWRPGT